MGVVTREVARQGEIWDLGGVPEIHCQQGKKRDGSRVTQVKATWGHSQRPGGEKSRIQFRPSFWLGPP